jgi:uncharacterized protein (TIGR03435 family)
MRLAALFLGVVALSAQQPPSFDVASVKPSPQNFLQIAPERAGGRIRWTTDLQYMVAYAYHMQRWRISGSVPGSDHLYAVDAATSASATEEEVRLMFQSLLKDRFKLAAHIGSKEGNGFVLTTGKGAPKIQQAEPGDPPPLPEWFRNRAVPPGELEGKVVATITSATTGNVTVRRASIAQFCEGLERVLQTFVHDETGLAGAYYFALEFPREDDNAGLPAAIREQLNLKLERRKGPVQIVVVDHIESTPSEN